MTYNVHNIWEMLLKSLPGKIVLVVGVFVVTPAVVCFATVSAAFDFSERMIHI